MTKRIWIIGASSGIGLELLKRWLEQGFFVIASSRSIEKNEHLKALRKTFGEQLVLMNVDVSDSLSIDAAITRLLTYERMDMWFYNVGQYESKRVADSDLAMYETMMQSNFLGAIAISLKLREHAMRLGLKHWVFNASLASYFGLPYSSAYASSKAALLTCLQSWQPELQQEGITVQIINHGFVKTRLTDKNDFSMPQLMQSSDAAKQIDTALQQPYRFEITFPKRLTWTLRLLRCLPYAFSLALMRKLLR